MSRPPVALAVLLLVTACEADDEPANKVVATEHPSKLPDWLSPHDKIDPAVWLRSREVGHMVADSDPEVGRIRRAIQQAGSRFFEDSRMIANRTAQTWAMLAEAQQPEHMVDIMTSLIDVADASPAKKLYGEMCQHYLNVRKTGHSRRETVQQLSNAYKSAGSAGLAGKIP